MTTRGGAARLEAWRQSPQGQQANADPNFSAILAQTIDAAYRRNQAIRRGAATPAPSAFGQAATGLEELSSEDFEALWLQRRADRNGVTVEEQLARETPDTDRGFFGNIRHDIGTLAASIPHIPQAIAGLGVDVGQGIADTVDAFRADPLQVGTDIVNPMSGYRRAATVYGLPGGYTGEAAEAFNRDDYQSSQAVVDSYHRTAGRVGAAFTPWRPVSQRRLSAYGETPLLSAVEDLTNIASVVAPVARAAAPGLRAAEISTGQALAGATRGPVARGVAGLFERGLASPNPVVRGATRGTMGAGRAMIAIDEAPARALRRVFQGGEALTRLSPRLNRAITMGREARDLRRGLNARLVEEASAGFRPPAAAQGRLAGAARAAGLTDDVVRTMEQANQVLSSGFAPMFNDIQRFRALYNSNPRLVERYLTDAGNWQPNVFSGTEAGALHFDVSPEAMNMAFDYIEGTLDPVLRQGMEEAAQITRGQMARRVETELRGEGRRAPLDPAQLGRTQFEDVALRKPNLQAQARLENQLFDVNREYNRLNRSVRAMPTTNPKFGPSVARISELKKAILAIQDNLAKHGKKMDELRLTTAQIPERMQGVWEWTQQAHNTINQTIDEARMMGAPPSAISLLEELQANIPRDIIELENAWARNGVMLEHIDAAGNFDPGGLLSVERQLRGDIKFKNPLSRTQLPDSPVNIRRTLAERFDTTTPSPSSLGGRGVLEAQEATRVATNEFAKKIIAPYMRSAEELLGSQRARALAGKDPKRTGAGLVEAMRQGAEQETLTPQVVQGQHGTIRLGPGEEWVLRDLDNLLTTVPRALSPTDQVFIPSQLARMLDGFNASLTEAGQRVVVRYLDKANSLYRHSWLGLSPRWHVGNMVSNAFSTMQAGHVSPLDMPRYIFEAIKLLKQAKKTGFLPTAEMNALFGHNLSGDAFNFVEALNPVGNKPGLLKRALRSSYEFNNYVDNISRTANYLAQMGDGMQYMNQPGWQNMVVDGVTLGERSQAAIRGALRVAGDFNNMTQFERAVIRRFVPFYPWYRHITRLMLTEPIYSPTRTLWMLHLGQLFYDEEDQQALPGFMQAAIPGGGLLWSTGGLSPVSGAIGSETMFNNPAQFLARSTNPVFQLAGASLFGEDQLLGGNPLTDQLGLETGPLWNEPQDMFGYASQLAGGPFVALRDLIQPQSRTDIGTERRFDGESQEPLRNRFGTAMQFLVGAYPYNPDVDFEEIREQQEESARRDQEEREYRERRNRRG